MSPRHAWLAETDMDGVLPPLARSCRPARRMASPWLWALFARRQVLNLPSGLESYFLKIMGKLLQWPAGFQVCRVGRTSPGGNWRNGRWRWHENHTGRAGWSDKLLTLTHTHTHPAKPQNVVAKSCSMPYWLVPEMVGGTARGRHRHTTSLTFASEIDTRKGIFTYPGG